MKLAYHYAMEKYGTETATARLLKMMPISRRWYYSNLKTCTRDVTLPARLERIDREVRNAKLLCPYKTGDVFRKFLTPPDTMEHVAEKTRMLKETVLQLRAHNRFHTYSFSVQDALGTQLMDISESIRNSRLQTMSRTHLHLEFVTETKPTKVPLHVPSRCFEIDDMRMFDFPMMEMPLVIWTNLAIKISAVPPDVSLESWDAEIQRARFLGGLFSGMLVKNNGQMVPS